MKLSPGDLLWLGILEDEPKLFHRKEKEIIKVLKKRGIPDHVIDAYLRRRAILIER